MHYIKAYFDKLPRVVFAHSFSTDSYSFKDRYIDAMEVVFFDQGKWELSIDNYMSFTADPGHIAIIPPGIRHSCSIESPGAIHTHSTLGVLCDFNIEICTEEDILSCNYLYAPNLQTSFNECFLLLPLYFAADSTVNAEPDIKNIIRKFNLRNAGFNLELSSIFLQLVSKITNRSVNLGVSHKTEHLPPSNYLYCRKIIDFLNENYSKQLDLNYLSSYIGLNVNYMCNVYKKTTNSTIVSSLNKIRINKAKELMAAYGMSINIVCKEVGIDNEQYFSRLFKKYEGISPNQYKILCIRGMEMS